MLPPMGNMQIVFCSTGNPCQKNLEEPLGKTNKLGSQPGLPHRRITSGRQDPIFQY